MLPDQPELKRDLKRIIDQYLLRQVHGRLGVFDQAPKHVVHEGASMRTTRADGSVEASSLVQASAEMTIQLSDIPRLTVDERRRELDNMADAIASQMSQHLFGVLNRSLDDAGQVVDQRGKPFSADAVFAALEAIQMDFDGAGNQEQISIVVPPAMQARVREVFERIAATPELRARHEELINRKREQWREREAARKLVG